MNSRKEINYNDMYIALDKLMTNEPLQMVLYCEIGHTVSLRPEKGAAVAAAEYLQEHYPDAAGFSPRNVRRMRNFYRTYENTPVLMNEAMELSWTLNVVIMENCDDTDDRHRYIRVAKANGSTKAELLQNIADRVHEAIAIEAKPELCNTEVVTKSTEEDCRVNARVLSSRTIGTVGAKHFIYPVAITILQMLSAHCYEQRKPSRHVKVLRRQRETQRAPPAHPKLGLT